MLSLSMRDAMACHRLIGECFESWDDAVSWQRHLASGLERLIGGFGSAFKLVRFQNGGVVMESAVLSEQSDDTMQTLFARCVTEEGHRLMPHLNAMGDALARRGAATLRYSDAGGGIRSYHRSEFYQRYLRGFGTGDTVVSSQAQPDGSSINLMTLRTRGDRTFSDRDEALLAFIGAALQGHVGTRLSTLGQLGVHGLSPRLRRTLEFLLEGDSEKQIATRLKLHPTTVHDYVRALYRYFGVHSRAELMARYVKRRVDTSV